MSDRPPARPGGNPEMGHDFPAIHWPWVLYAAAGACAVGAAWLVGSTAATLAVAGAFLLVASVITGLSRLWSEVAE